MRAYIRSYLRQSPLTLMGFAGRFLISASSCKLLLTARFDQPRSDLSFHHLLIACATGGSRIAMLTSPICCSTRGTARPNQLARSVRNYHLHADCAHTIRAFVSAMLTPPACGSNGACDRTISRKVGLERSAMCEECPCDPCVLVRNGYGGDVLVPSCKKPPEPGRGLIGLALGMADH